ncbi:MAG: type I-C CRISPR-associated protein Cas5c [Nocardioides sp.]|uniref:type I-C CRISPR-associated protein Cas5c n=1 Tax=Nocardioides sp. TaxID=35761 RepID=UPI0039E24C33
MASHDWSALAVPGPFRYPPLALQVAGDAAAFTRPEFTSERLSYPLMTPTAAIGLLSTVFWKPEIRWVIERIDVLAPVRWTNLRRNEVAVPITRDAVKQGYLDADKHVQQRMTTMLRDVRYRIHAHVWVHPEARDQDAAKWREQFRRRVDHGQTFRTPYLGMREFHADIEPVDDTAPVKWDEDLGIMLHSITYDERTGKETYDWFDARVENGVMHVPRRGLLAQHNAEVGP